MWRRLFLASALVLLAGSGPLLAADLGPIAPAEPAWAGFYAGPTLGWARGHSSGYYEGLGGTPPPPLTLATLYIFCPHECLGLDPVTPGALAGYNFQFARILAGIEGDVGWIGAKTPIIWAADGSQRWDQFGVTWTGHLRGRVGYAFGPYLPYVAGGLALAGYNIAHFRSDDTGSVLYTADDTRAGYTIGGGIEIANPFPTVLPGWAFRGEYLYDHFADKQYDWVPGMRYSVTDLTLHTLRAAATYRFFAR